MTEEKHTVTFTVVAFRYDQKASVMYENNASIEKIAKLVEHALTFLHADVISIRRVYEKCPVP